ncbi:MAG TPA: hypothetical protein IAC41_12555 [Candidatus Merdenecus merdavium]|nr:hypothetical protein [Candidatus Merdenecus merdavium]
MSESVNAILLAINNIGKTMEQGFQESNRRFDEIDVRFEKIEEKLEEHDARFERIEEKLEEHDAEFKRINKKLEEHDDQFKENADIFKSLNKRITNMELLLENEVTRNITIIAEGHQLLMDKLDEALKITHKEEINNIKINSLREKVRKNTEDIEGLQDKVKGIESLVL